MNRDDVERWRMVDARFNELIDLVPEARRAYLDAHCPDPEIRQEVERLLAASADAGTFLETYPPVPQVTGLDVTGGTVAAFLPDLAGRQMGAYRILREIGRGGMGAVYLAERADGQFSQRVAIKRLHAGFDSATVHERFNLERRILARLEHPNITRLIDGGIDAEGCPYLVMEYVEGLSITRYCDERRLSIPARLDLFVTVCRAVHFAHRNLIVHRDLKPSNILVAEDGTVKLLDFGIAKLLDGDATAALAGDSPLAVTQSGMRLLTPGYASPEQVRGEAITTASDVYSLGVVLYELLTGRLPYRLPSRLLKEVERVICETEPERPSTAVTRLDDVATRTETVQEDTGHLRGTTVEKLRRQLAGDLDNVVLMALRKEPERRYASAEAFLEDIRRFLEHRPVEARPNTITYRVGKFARRYRVGVATAAAMLVLLAGLSVFFTWRIAGERDRSRLEAEKAEQTSAFLLDLFDALDPFGTQAVRGDTLTARTLLARGVARVRADLVDQPAVQAAMLHKIAQVYEKLGMNTEAAAMLHEALPKARAALGPSSKEVASMLSDLAIQLNHQERYDEAEDVAREALAIWRTSLGEQHAQYAAGLDKLALVLIQKGRYEEADSLLRRAMSIQNAAGDSLGALESIADLSVALTFQGDYRQADSLSRAALSVRRRLLGEDHPSIIVGLHALARVVRLKGDFPEAEALTRELLARLDRIVDEKHPLVLTSLNNLAMILQEQNEFDEAEQVYRRALALEIEVSGERSLAATQVMGNLGGLLRATGRLEQAEAFYRKGMALREEMLDPGHPDLAIMRNNLANVLRDRGRYAEAAVLYRQAVEVFAGVLPPQHPHTAVFRSNLAFCLLRLKRYAEAEELLLRACEDLMESVGERHPYTTATRERLVELYETLGRSADADRYRISSGSDPL